MFPSGRVFLAKCVAVSETSDGTSDTAALQLIAAVTHGPFTSETPLPFASLATATPSSLQKSDQLFCVGNPSCIDLESSSSSATVEFTPATWHTSVGQVVSSVVGELMTHSCWTYWGHSGAPLFNSEGCIVGLHCAWDEDSGVRQAQRLETLTETLSLVACKINNDTDIDIDVGADIDSKGNKNESKKRRVEVVDLFL
jgi:hypothetical protein